MKSAEGFKEILEKPQAFPSHALDTVLGGWDGETSHHQAIPASELSASGVLLQPVKGVSLLPSHISFQLPAAERSLVCKPGVPDVLSAPVRKVQLALLEIFFLLYRTFFSSKSVMQNEVR